MSPLLGKRIHVSVRATLRLDTPGNNSSLGATNQFLSSLPLLDRDDNEPQKRVEVFKPMRGFLMLVGSKR